MRSFGLEWHSYKYLHAGDLAVSSTAKQPQSTVLSSVVPWGGSELKPRRRTRLCWGMGGSKEQPAKKSPMVSSGAAEINLLKVCNCFAVIESKRPSVWLCLASEDSHQPGSIKNFQTCSLQCCLRHGAMERAPWCCIQSYGFCVCGWPEF